MRVIQNRYKGGVLTLSLTVLLIFFVSIACAAPVQIEPPQVTLIVPQNNTQPTPITDATPQQAVPTLTAQPPLSGEAGATELPNSSLPDTGLPFDDNRLLVNLYQQLIPGVVSITVFVNSVQGLGQGAGSGFILDTDGNIVTNNHVVDGAELITVTFSNGDEAEATLVGTDDDSDLAVIHVDSLPGDSHPLPLGDSDAVQVGEWVVAIGNPFELSGSMSVGIVSALGRMIESGVTPFSIPQVIQTDAAINPGNSGGPLLNLRGEVIGVNAQIATNGNIRANAGVGFAIPSNIVRRVTPALIENGAYQWPWMGVEGTSVNLAIQQANNLPTQHGAYISNVTQGGPADQAGLRGSTGETEMSGLPVPTGGDVVIAVDGQQVKDFTDLLVETSNRNPGDQMNLTVIRDGAETSITITLGARPENFNTIPGFQSP